MFMIRQLSRGCFFGRFGLCLKMFIKGFMLFYAIVYIDIVPSSKPMNKNMLIWGFGDCCSVCILDGDFAGDL